LKAVATFWQRPGPLSRRFPRAGRYAPLLAWGYLAAMMGAALTLWLWGDRWPPATALLFGPRWVLLLPAPLLIILAVLFRPNLLLPILGGLGVALGPAMGYRTGWRAWLGTGTGSLRVITYNIDWSQNPSATLIPNELTRFEPDVMVFQECNPAMQDPEHWPAGWKVRAEGSICLGSRYPVLVETADSTREVGDLGDTGIARFFRLEGPDGPIDIAVVHLETPRKGLEMLRYSGDISRMDPSTLVRRIGSSRVRSWISRQSSDAIVAGDFNMPVESVIYRKDWSDCRNAFSAVGRGFGYTRILRRFSVRIDHVLSCGEGWVPVRALVGPHLGSDHLPLIVDLKRR
jgi:endonuclease/exonuclease/phosphatase (EEP) superfamily protein YafD